MPSANPQRRAFSFRPALLVLAAALTVLLAISLPAFADPICGPDSRGVPQALYCGDDTCQVRMCGPGQYAYPIGFPPGSPCAGKRISYWGVAGDGITQMTVCVSLSLPHIGCHWRSGPPNNHRYGGDMSEDCSAAPNVKMPSWSTMAPHEGPKLDPREVVAGNLRASIHEFRGGSASDRMKDYLMKSTFAAIVKNAFGTALKNPGGQPVGELGRFVARQAGVGQCTRHYYNKSDTYWGIAMFYAGTCDASGMAPGEHSVCIFPPHSTGTLHYANFGDVADGGQIAIAGQNYRGNFDLRTVGCYIQHHGRTGNATLNDPADGDIVTVGR